MIRRLLAVLLPALVVAGWAIWVLSPTPSKHGPHAQRLDDLMAESAPQVVVLGNSHVQYGLAEADLATALSLEEGAVDKLYIPGSSMPVWYAVLKNRVLANGHQPQLVVVCDLAVAMLSTRQQFHQGQQRFDEQLADAEPVLASKIGGQHYLLQRMNQRRTSTRDDLLDNTRNVAVGLAFTDWTGGLVDAGHTHAEVALKRVFDLNNVDAAGRKRVIPVVEAKRAEDDKSWNLDIDKSLVSDFLDLTDQIGARVVFLRMPMPASNKFDRIPQEAVNALIERLNERGAYFGDLSGLPLSDVDILDASGHLAPSGRDKFTRAAGEMLIDIDALGADPLPRAFAPLTPSAVRQEGGRRKDGSLWLHPGDKLVIEFDEGWSPERGDLEIEVVAGAYGSGDAFLTVAGKRVVIRDKRWGRYVVKPPPPSGAWNASIAVPAAGPAVKVQAVKVGGSYVVGDNANAPRLRFIGPGTGFPEVTDSAVPQLAAPEIREGPKPDVIVAIAPQLQPISFQRTGELGLRNCSPVRLTLDGAVLPHHNSNPYAWRQGPGKAAHPDRRVMGSTPDGRPVGDRTVALQLDEDRRCLSMRPTKFAKEAGGVRHPERWLYPGDTTRLTIKHWKGKLPNGAGGLELLAYPMNAASTGSVDVRVLVGGSVHFERSVPQAQLSKGPFITRLPTIAPGAGPLALELSNPSGDYVLVTTATFLDGDSVEGAAQGAVAAADPVPQGGRKPAFGATRTGRAAVPVAEVRDMGRGCRVHHKLAPYWFLLDSALTKKLKVGPVSPLMVNGLTRAKDAGAVGNCNGKVAEFRGGLITSAKTPVKVGLDPALPLRRGGRQAWWVYPGTTVTLPLRKAGIPLEVVAHRLYDVTPPSGTPTFASQGAMDVVVDRRTLRARGKTGEALTITNPKDGPFLLLQRVKIAGTVLIGD